MRYILNLPYTEIKLVSVNKKYCNTSYTLTKEYRNFKEMLSWILKKHCKILTDKDVGVEIVLGTRHDIDNVVKPILDSLENIVIVNDKQVTRLVIDKKKLMKNENQYISMVVYEKNI